MNIPARLIPLILAIGALPGGVTAQENVPPAEAQRQIQAHIARLEGYRTVADNLYEYENAGPTLDGISKGKGVDWARHYADDWGRWIYYTWSFVRFYRIHREALDDSLRVVNAQGFASPRQLAYLRDGMDAVSGEHEALMEQMNRYAELYAEKGLVLDKIHALPPDAPESGRDALRKQASDIDARIEQLKINDIAPFYERKIFGSIANMCGPDTEIRSFAGKWNTTWGAMTLAVKGDRISGNYAHDGGRIEGTVSAGGMEAEGHWAEQPTYKGPDDAGAFRLKLASDGRSFSGPWGYGEGLDRGDWKASRANDPCAPPPPGPVAKEEQRKSSFIVDRLSILNLGWEGRLRGVRGEIDRFNREIDKQSKLLSSELDAMQRASLDVPVRTTRKEQMYGQLKAVRDEIAGLNTARQPVPSDKLAAEKRLDDAFWEARRQELVAQQKLHDASIPVEISLGHIGRLKDQRAALAEELNTLTAAGMPRLEKAEIWNDSEKTWVFRAVRGGNFEELDRLNTEVRDLGVAVRELKQAMDRTNAGYREQFTKVTHILEALHGDISRGTGVLSTLRNLWSGAIMRSATKQAAVEMAFHLYDLAGAFAKGGPALAIAEGLSKLAMEGIKAGTKGDDGPGVVAKYGGDVADPHELAQVGAYRAVEDSMMRYGRDILYQKLNDRKMSRTAANIEKTVRELNRPDKAKLLDMMRNSTTSVADLKKQAEIVNRNRNLLHRVGSQLRSKAPTAKPAYGMAGVKESLAKDALSTELKALFQAEEDNLWLDYYLAVGTQRALLSLYQVAADSYWNAYDRLQYLRQERDYLAARLDRESGFTIETREPFDEDTKLAIYLKLRQPEGHREDVTLGSVAAQPNPADPHVHLISADRLPKPANARQPMQVTLRVDHQLPVQRR
jgi:hypothetical protein